MPEPGTKCHRKHQHDETLVVFGVAANVVLMNEIGFFHTVSHDFFKTNYIIKEDQEQ